MMLLGLMSRWTIPRSCANCSASSNSVTMRIERATGIGVFGAWISFSSLPRISSITMYAVSLSSPESNTWTTLG